VAPKIADTLPLKTSVELPQKPEEQELARKLHEQAEIESDLADRELQCASLRAELGAFERQFLHFVGSRYAELDELKARIAERIAQDQPENSNYQIAAQEARAKSNESKSAAGEKSSAQPKAFQPSKDMKHLYREVARRIHPDLTSDANDRSKRQQLMTDANEAYERGDGEQLAKILAEYEHRPEAVVGTDAGAELIRAIRKISRAKTRVAEIETGIQIFMRSDLYHLKVRVDQAEQYGHDMLKEMTENVESQIAQAKKFLKSSAQHGA
jgi:hypothetical protein